MLFILDFVSTPFSFFKLFLVFFEIRKKKKMKTKTETRTKHRNKKKMQRELDRKSNYECTLAVRYILPPDMESAGKKSKKIEDFKKSTQHIDFSNTVSIFSLMKCSTIWQMAENSEFIQNQLMFISQRPDIGFDMIKFASEKLGQAVKKLWKHPSYNLEATHLHSLSPEQLMKLSKEPILLLNLQIFFQSAYILCNLKGMNLALWKDHCESRYMLLAMALCYGAKTGMMENMEKEFDDFYCSKASSAWILFSDFCESFYKEKRFKISVLGIVMKKAENWFWLVKILKSPNKQQMTAMYKLHLSQMGHDSDGI